MPTTNRLSRFRSLLSILVILATTATIQAAELQYPLSIAVTESGTIYLADRNLPGVWKVEAGSLSVFFEGSKKFRTPLNAIRCVAIDRQGKLWAGDSSTRDIYRFDEQGKPIGLTQKPADATSTSAAGDTAPQTAEKGAQAKNDASKTDASPSQPPAATDKPAPAKPRFVFGEIGIPMDLAFDKTGSIFVSDLEIHRVVKVSPDGSEVKEFAQIQAPRGLCFDAEENLWVISGRRLVKISPAGETTVVVEDGVFDFPHTVAVAADKTAYVCDGYAKAIWKVPSGGKPEKLVSGEPFVNPVGMRLVGDKLFVVDPRAKAVFEITLDGKVSPLPLAP